MASSLEGTGLKAWGEEDGGSAEVATCAEGISQTKHENKNMGKPSEQVLADAKYYAGLLRHTMGKPLLLYESFEMPAQEALPQRHGAKHLPVDQASHDILDGNSMEAP